MPAVQQQQQPQQAQPQAQARQARPANQANNMWGWEVVKWGTVISALIGSNIYSRYGGAAVERERIKAAAVSSNPDLANLRGIADQFKASMDKVETALGAANQKAEDQAKIIATQREVIDAAKQQQGAATSFQEKLKLLEGLEK